MGGIQSEALLLETCWFVCVCFNVGMEFQVCLSGGEPNDDDRSRQGHGLMNET